MTVTTVKPSANPIKLDFCCDSCPDSMTVAVTVLPFPHNPEIQKKMTAMPVVTVMRLTFWRDASLSLLPPARVSASSHLAAVSVLLVQNRKVMPKGAQPEKRWAGGLHQNFGGNLEWVDRRP